jgi:hypothetical protein
MDLHAPYQKEIGRVDGGINARAGLALHRSPPGGGIGAGRCVSGNRLLRSGTLVSDYQVPRGPPLVAPRSSRRRSGFRF